MKISDFVKELIAVQLRYGDIDIKGRDYYGGSTRKLILEPEIGQTEAWVFIEGEIDNENK